MDMDDDTHLCLRCNSTIIGLDNYVIHRKEHCTVAKPDTTNQFPSNSVSGYQSVTDVFQSNTCTPSASDFFSYLELQSTATPSDPSKKELTSSFQQGTRTYSEQEEESDHEFGNHDVFEESDDDTHPPQSHTGGKWKPGSRPEQYTRNQWERNPSSGEDDEDLNLALSEPSIQRQDHEEKVKKKLECKLCNRKYSDKGSYERHLDTRLHFKRSHLERDVRCLTSGIGLDSSKQQFKKAQRLIHLPQKGGFVKSTLKTELKCIQCCKRFVKPYEFALHLLSDKHRQAFNLREDWVNHVLQNEAVMVKSLLFRCLICSFYFAQQECFLAHVREKQHLQKAAQARRSLICTSCQYECYANDEMLNHLTSAVHNKNVTEILPQHPVILSENSIRKSCDICPKQCEIKKCVLSSEKKIRKENSSDSVINPYINNLTVLNNRSLKISKNGHKSKLIRENIVKMIKNTEYKMRKNWCCKECKKEFGKLDYYKHVLSSHPENCHECKICKIKFFSSSKLQKHMNTAYHKKQERVKTRHAKHEGNLICEMCNCGFLTLADIIFHKIDFHHSEGLEMHVVGNVEKMQESMKEVDYQFIRNEKKNIKDIQKRYPCPYCRRIFSRAVLRSHLIVHTGEKPHTCHICRATFTQKGTLMVHIKRHLGIKKMKCDHCNYACVTKGALNRHLQVHLVERPRPFLCEECGSSHSDRGSLNYHMKIHLKKFDYKCPVDGCHHACRSKSELKIHMCSHTNERPYLCDKCGYAGKTSGQLKKHQKCHTGEKPFKCRYCSYSATFSSHLRRHMRLHTGSKPYQCPYCSYSCNTQENIRKHILKTKKHIGKKMYPCRFCEFGCNDFQEYKKHLLDYHLEHFPEGERDIDSSYVSGLYTKDNTNVDDGFIPIDTLGSQSELRETSSCSLSRKHCKTRRKKNNTTDDLRGATVIKDEGNIVEIPEMARLQEVDHVEISTVSEATVKGVTVTAQANSSALTLDNFEPKVDLHQAVTGVSDTGVLSNTRIELATSDFFITDNPDYFSSEQTLVEELPDSLHGSVTHGYEYTTYTEENNAETIIIYMPV
ncbi:zinc finger protein 26-like [Limulus polyphemus]|uniref:Zinc finger protein 26-like n=1 Tax=Limulus polyphemus TaxID=6850 RepID=A0ABM1S382_LIMPO|nr:zinc finger protein 26-like [Limulus polyphemus]XP_022238087.1 zinc finger protein 26-like [Limulus polyphemus]